MDASIATIGHNRAPSEIEMAKTTFRDLSDFMADHPVIENEDEARKAKLFIDRGKAAIADLDSAKEREAKPLHTAWKECLAKFTPAKESLEKLLAEMRSRQTIFARGKESKLLAEAAERRRIADEALLAAQRAEQAEWNAKDSAANGEIGVDVGDAINRTNELIVEAKVAHRQAALADRESRVRIGGGFGKVQTLRNVEVLHLSDYQKALAMMGVSDKVEEAILSAARAWRKEHGRLPEGVLSILERRI